MSSVNGHKDGDVFPAILETDPFGAFPCGDSKMDSADPFASSNGATDPFSTFAMNGTSSVVSNPFLDGNLSAGECSASSNPGSGTATPIDELQSLQSEEAPWPGNNTAASSTEISCDSANVNTSSDVVISQDHVCSNRDTSESSASSGRAVPNIALDSDSGNLTADANETSCLPATVYSLMDSAENGHDTQATEQQVSVPKIVLTEATMISERSSAFEVVENGSSAGEGHSRLLDSSGADTPQDQCHLPGESISSDDCSAVQMENLSTMNISLLNTTSDRSDSMMDPQNTEPSQAHNFFVQSNGCDEAEVEECEMRSELINEVPTDGVNGDGLPVPRSDRVFTSSPINPRTIVSEEKDSNGPIAAWERGIREKINLKDEKEVKEIEELRQQAKAELERWYRERQTRIDAQHALHLENQAVQYAERPEKEQKTIWQRMATLAVELNQAHKVDEKRTDTSKMKYLLQLLATRPPLLKQ